MVLVVSKAFVNLCPSNVRKTAQYFVDGSARLIERNNVVDANAGAFNRRVSASNARNLDDVTITGRNHVKSLAEFGEGGKNFLLGRRYGVFVAHVVAVMVELADTLL
jgi:hypothetical protein